MESTFEEEELFSNLKKETIDPEEPQTQLAMGNDEEPLVKEETIDASEVKKEAENGELLRYGGYAAREEAEFNLNKASRKRKCSPVVMGSKYAVKQDLKEEVESRTVFNAHVYLSNQDLIDGCVQDDGVEDFGDVNGENGKEEEMPMDNADSMNVLGNSCPVDGCSMKLSSSEELLKHMKTHSAPWLCGICKRSLQNSTNLRRHYMIHTREKPRRDAIFDHQWTHREHPYKCDACDYEAPYHSSLKRHKYIHAGKKMHSCTVCDKQYLRSSDLARHTRIHTGEKPYECDICGYRTYRNSILKCHKRTHYPCTTCRYKAAGADQLRMHKENFSH